MSNTLRIIKIKGIPVEIHISWFLAFFLFSIFLSLDYFPAEITGLSSVIYWLMGLLTTLLVFTSILAHEFGHSLVALREGIPIKKIILFIFGGVAQMESEPSNPLAELKVTAAGPLTSFFIALLFGSTYYILDASYLAISSPLFFLARLNLIVAVFNLIPAFPLDGGRLLRSTIWRFNKNLLKSTRIAVSIGSFFSFLSMGLGFLLIFLYGDLSGLWFIFLGWIIYQAGQSSYSQLVFKETFSGMSVSELMSTKLLTVAPDATLDDLADIFLLHKFGAFPVVYGSTTHGIVTLQNMKEIPREKWPDTRVSQIMTPLKETLIFDPNQDAAAAMMKMSTENTGRALVMRGGELLGILSRTDMMKFIQMHMVLGTD